RTPSSRPSFQDWNESAPSRGKDERTTLKGHSYTPGQWRGRRSVTRRPPTWQPGGHIGRSSSGTALAFRVIGRTTDMLYYALLFLMFGLVAGALGLFVIAAVASQIAWVLFLIGIVLLVVHLVTGRTRVP